MRIFRVRVIFAPQEKNHELCYDRYNLLYKIDRFYSEGVGGFEDAYFVYYINQPCDLIRLGFRNFPRAMNVCQRLFGDVNNSHLMLGINC